MGAGGSRMGAGRPAGTGKFGVPTKPIRVPTHLIDDVLEFIAEGKVACPLYASTVKAGFPSPAEDYAEEHLDLNAHLIHHPASTFFLRVSGDSMKDVGIFNGDLLVVDRSLEPADGKIVIAAVNGELTVKRLQKNKESVSLIAENPDYPPIILQPDDHIHLWGVVTHAIHAVSLK
jgi:DNA polymerase V